MNRLHALKAHVAQLELVGAFPYHLASSLIDECIDLLENAVLKEPPKPFGDGKQFSSLPGDHLMVYGPNEISLICHTEWEAADAWKALEKAYAYGFQKGGMGMFDDQEPVMWQYRWLNPSNEKHPESMMKWEPCEPKYAGQTLEKRIEELLSYESDGKPQYEVRALYASPSLTPPSLQKQLGVITDTEDEAFNELVDIVCDKLIDSTPDSRFAGEKMNKVVRLIHKA